MRLEQHILHLPPPFHPISRSSIMYAQDSLPPLACAPNHDPTIDDGDVDVTIRPQAFYSSADLQTLQSETAPQCLSVT